MSMSSRVIQSLSHRGPDVRMQGGALNVFTVMYFVMHVHLLKLDLITQTAPNKCVQHEVQIMV